MPIWALAPNKVKEIHCKREGLDIPEVSLVAILDADAQTESIRACLEVTNRRREIQGRFNEEHGITPESIKAEIRNILGSVYEADYMTMPTVAEADAAYSTDKELLVVIGKLKEEMKQAAKALEFEKAALLHDRIKELTKVMLELGGAA